MCVGMSFIRHESIQVIGEAEGVAGVRDALADALSKEVEARLKDIIEVGCYFIDLLLINRPLRRYSYTDAVHPWSTLHRMV
jgi:hypothetical protein